VYWVKDMDAALTDIAVVTGNSAKQMSKVYDNIIASSKELRVAAKEYAEASLIFYQQGLASDQVKQRTDTTIQAAKAAGVAVSEMATQLTAVWNTYDMATDKLANAASIGAKLGAETAVDFAYIAEAMQSSASAASQMGVSYESLASIIATVGSVTQQSASTVGNAYKTILSRFDQLKSTGTDGEVTLGLISSQLQAMGVNVLDAAGNLKELDDVIMDLGLRWDTYSEKQQIAIAEIAGGTRQYGQFLALMNNFDDYLKNLESAQGEKGSTTL